MRNILIIVLSLFTLIACQQSDTKTAAKKVAKVQKQNRLLAPKAFKAKMEATANKQVIDLRTHGELHRIGPIAGARQVDFQNQNFKNIINAYDKNKTTFVYCASGTRSAAATKLLKTLGFKTVYDLDGGITAWKNSGFPIQSHSH